MLLNEISKSSKKYTVIASAEALCSNAPDHFDIKGESADVTFKGSQCANLLKQAKSSIENNIEDVGITVLDISIDEVVFGISEYLKNMSDNDIDIEEFDDNITETAPMPYSIKFTVTTDASVTMDKKIAFVISDLVATLIWGSYADMNEDDGPGKVKFLT